MPGSPISLIGQPTRSVESARQPSRSELLISLPRVLGRLLQGAFVVLISASIAFLLVIAIPGDEYSQLEMSPNITAEEVAQLRANFSSEEPIAARYWYWLRHAAQGDLLVSTSHGNKRVLRVIGEQLPNTLQLMSLAFMTSMFAGIMLGAWQGANIGSRRDRAAGILTLGILSIPEFWLAIILLVVFALLLGWFPSQGMKDFDVGPSLLARALDRLHHIFLPWLSLTLIDIAVISRFQRAAMRDLLGQQFLTTARAKGVPELQIKLRHALRVAVLPIITIAGMYFPALFVGAVLVEKVFAWPGIGRVLTQAIDQHDYFLVAGVVAVGSAMTALGSLIADLTREYADPRLRA